MALGFPWRRHVDDDTSPVWIAHSSRRRGRFGDYVYDIFLGQRRVGRYGHNYRGDAHWIRFGLGLRQECPLGAVWEFVDADAAGVWRPKPDAEAWLRRRLAGER